MNLELVKLGYVNATALCHDQVGVEYIYKGTGWTLVKYEEVEVSGGRVPTRSLLGDKLHEV